MMNRKMTAREYLEQAYRLNERIDCKLTQLSQLKDMATNITSNLSDVCVQKTHNDHKLEDTIVKIVEQEKEINAEIDAMVDLKDEIKRTIEKVPSVEQRLVLEERYLCFRSWEKIATHMSYGIRWVYKIHGKALATVEKILEEK